MKTLLLISLLTLVTACGSGGGSSSGKAPNAPINPVDLAEQVYTYDIRIEGAAGAAIASNLVTNFALNDQTNNNVTVTLDNTNLAGAQFFGRNLFWEVQSKSNIPVTVKIIRDGVEVKSETLTSNGQVITLTNNL